ncbi:peptidase M16 [Haloferula helveola]|uniref:Peptidase M16 n=1 Tax=Haloferula helveola TaxID=490095 RepID=A0ABM7RES3_9BACT|nr:peptidase M16 [Haloferula helveola]
MRNPAPIVLTLLLAIAATVFILNRPNPPEAPPTEPAPPAAEPIEEEEAATPPPTALEPRSWPQESSDLKPEEGAVFGNLPNGMRYIILPNGEPPERVSIRLHIAAGSLMEAEDQRGLAHFLEHMVFNGSKNFTPDELIPRMQRLGIAFGAHVNAYTSFDETVYMLDLPDLSDEMLDLGFTVMRDFADGALLKTEEIDKERGVILSEKTSRDSVSYRLMQQQFSTLMPDSLITKRFPIGEEEVIKNAPRERFVDLYERYYTPERMTFIVVGDIEPAAAEERIKNAFGTLENPAAPGTDPDLGALKQAEGLEALIFSDKEVPATELGLLTIEPYEKKADTSENRAAKLPLGLANAMLGTRFDRLAKKEGAPILGGSASRQDLFNYVTLGSIDVSVADDRWQDAVPVMEQEFRRAREFGFTKAEFAEAKANLLNSYEQAVKSKDSRKSDGMATSIARSINDGRVLTSPETNLAVAAAALEDLTPEICHAAFKEFWADKGYFLILTTKEQPEGAKEELAKIYEQSSEQTVEAPEETEVAAFAYTDFGQPGLVESEEEIEGLGITRLVLDNGVTVNLKQTDFEKNRIRIAARIGLGKLVQPKDKVGLGDFATAVVEGGGIGVHSVDELQQIFAGKNVSFGFSVDEDSFSLSGGTTPEDLGLQLQAMTAQLLHPGYRQEGVEQFRKAVPMIFQQMKHTAAGSMQKMSSWIRGDDPRFAFPESADVFLGYEVDDVREWLDAEFVPAPIELNIIGDFDPETLKPLVLATFGAIEKRKPRSAPDDALLKVEFPETPQTKNLTYESKIPVGQAVVLWKAIGPKDNEETFRRLNLLADIFGDRLREEIREKLGASYSPNSGASGSSTLDDFGFMIAMIEGKPEDAEQLAEVTVGLAKTLASGGATDDELDRALKPLLADIDKSMRDNSYWLGAVMSGSTENERKFELARGRRDDVASITLDEVNELAGKYYATDKAIQVIIKPEETE